MSLKSKISLVSGAVILLSVLLNFAVLRALVYPSFVELERAEAQRNMARVIEALDNDLTFLSSINRDWSNWDDTYVFALSGDESYVEENFYTEALQDVDIPSSISSIRIGGACSARSLTSQTGRRATAATSSWTTWTRATRS